MATDKEEENENQLPKPNFLKPYEFQPGNNNWTKRKKHGRDAVFTDPEKLREGIEEYFADVIANPWITHEAIKSGPFAGQIMAIPTVRPFTLIGLSTFLGVHSQWFSEFEKICSDDFTLVIKWARDVIHTQKFEGAAVGAFKENLIARDLGMAERIDATSKGQQIGQMPAIQVFNTAPPMADNEGDVEAQPKE